MFFLSFLVCKQLFSLAGLNRNERADLIEMREVMGIMQHHDAVTGTEQQHVADDYARLLTIGFNDCDDITTKALSKLMGSAEPIQLTNCMLLNVSSCPVTESNDDFVVTIYNPLSREVRPLVRLPVASTTAQYTAKCPEGKEHPTQVSALPTDVLVIPGRPGEALGELTFLTGCIPPLGYKSFYVSKVSKSKQTKKPRTFAPKEPTSLGYDGRFINLDASGLLESITVDGKTESVQMDFGFYKGAVGNNEVSGVRSNRSSGAYIFRPNGTVNLLAETPSVTIVQGAVVSEVRYKFSDWISSVLRIYRGAEPFNVEHEWLVGPIPIDDQGFGKEVVIRYHVKGVHNGGEFLTDSNGREMLKRKMNYRPTWNVDLDEKISGNYYPVTTRIAIEDGDNIWSVVTDRSQGGSSLQDGTMELMVHRRLTHDDAFGVGEALNETAFGVGLVVRGIHYIVPGSHADARKVVQNKVLHPWYFLSSAKNIPFEDWRTRYRMVLDGLKKSLDDRVQILTLEPWKDDGTHLLRLENIMEIDDGHKGNDPVTVNLNDLFAHWTVLEATEMVLGGNAPRSEVERLKWTELGSQPLPAVAPVPGLQVTLKPMEIRTFLVKLQHS